MMDEQVSLRWKAILAFTAIYVVWGSTYVAIKFAVETIPPFLAMSVRCLVAGSILYAWGRIRSGVGVQRHHWRGLLIIGGSFFLAGHGLLAWAQQKVPSGLAALLIASEPLWIVSIESFLLRDSKVRTRGILGLTFGFGGMAVLIVSMRELGFSQADFVGVVAILVGTVAWGGGAVYSRVAALPKSPAVAAGLELVSGGVLLFVVSLILGEPQNVRLSDVSAKSILSVGYLILLGSVVTFSAYVWLLTVTSATRVSTHTYVNPVIAVFIGWVVAGEALTISIVAASLMIVASVYLVLSDQTGSGTPLTSGRGQPT